jgi:hypothetical protein
VLSTSGIVYSSFSFFSWGETGESHIVASLGDLLMCLSLITPLSLSASAFPVAGASFRVGDGHDHNAVCRDSVHNAKGKPSYRALPMNFVDGRESLRIGRNRRKRHIDRTCEAYRCLRASFGIPVKRFVEVATGFGEIINRQHSNPLLQRGAKHPLGFAPTARLGPSRIRIPPIAV